MDSGLYSILPSSRYYACCANSRVFVYFGCQGEETHVQPNTARYPPATAANRAPAHVRHSSHNHPPPHTLSHVHMWRLSAPPFSRFLQALTSCCTQKLVCWICPTSPSAKTTVRHSQSLPRLTQLKLRHAISLRYLPEKDNSRCQLQSQRTNSRCRNRMSR